MRFCVLGPLTVADADSSVTLKPSKLTALLAALLIHPNQPASVEHLQAVIWGDCVPVAAKATLQTYVMRLRRLFRDFGLAEQIIVTTPTGYRLPADESTLDLLDFRCRITNGCQQNDPAQRLELLRGALSIWTPPPSSGPVLANVPSEVLHRDHIPALVEEWLHAVELRVDLELQLGRFRDLPPELMRLTAAYPSNERFSGQLIETLYLNGRQRDALSEYRRIRGLLRDELGTDPSDHLQQLELRVLRGESLPDRQAPPHVEITVPAAVQSVMPPDSAHFVGRTKEIRLLTDRLTDSSRSRALVVVTGPPGIGKSTLAIHLAHLLSPHFGDQVSYLAAGSALDSVPRDTRLAVIEDPEDCEQVLSLLPGGPGTAAIVTSRDSLTGLAARRGAFILRVQPMPAADATALLRRVLGTDRLGTDQTAIAELLELCGGFPAALMFAASRLQVASDGALADYVRWLRADPIRRLSMSRDHSVSIGHLIAEHVGALPASMGEAFLWLAHRPPALLDSAQSGILLDIADRDAERMLEQLVESSLLEVDSTGRYSMHTLLRAVGQLLAAPSPTAGITAANHA